MGSMVFTQQSEGLYQSDDYPALFLWDSAAQGASKSLTDFHKETCCLIFCDMPPGDLEQFALRIKEFRRDPLLKLVWVQHPDLLDDPGKLTGLRIQNNKLIDRGLFRFRNHTLFIHRESRIVLDNSQVILSSPKNKSSVGYLRTRDGSINTGSIEGDICIEIARQRPGRLSFVFHATEEDLDLLDAGVRYFFPDTEKGDGFVDSMRFPIFSPGQNILSLQAYLHPLHSLRRDHEQPETILQFRPSDTISTYFRTPLGQPINFKPGDQAGFIYERKTQTIEGKDSDAWYLTLWGTFAIASEESPYPSLMPGASGTEFYQGGFDGSPFCVTFRNGCPAYLPGFQKNPLTNSLANTQAQTVSNDNLEDSLYLQDTATTSYMRFHGGLATYFAQPSEQPFYVPGGPDDSASFLATPFCNLSDSSIDLIPAQKECVPVLPLGGIEPAMTQAALRLELRMAAPVRGEKMKFFQQDEEGNAKNAYSPLPAEIAGGVSSQNIQASASDGITCVTPGGYIGHFSHDLSEWKKMIVTTGSDNQPFSIQNPNGPLRNALLAGRRIAVISDPILFLEDDGENNTSLENTLLNISGWGFDLDPKLWLRYGTILVFKDHPESLEELVKRPDEWRETQYLNLDPWDVCDKLQEAAETAKKALEGGDSDFGPFIYQIWQNPDWNGFLAFNVPVSPVGFPDDLAVIAGGVDPSLLKAHHVGVSSSAIERQESGAVSNGRGALFGLVDYNSDTELGQDSSYDWTVRKLKARFRNARLQSFQARIDLCIRELFGDKSSTIRKITEDKGGKGKSEKTEIILGAEHQPKDTIVLAGHYEEHDGKGRYTFKSEEKTKFYPQSGVVDELMLNRAGFETISVDPVKDGLQMRGRFLLSGLLKFFPQDGFDIFSYEKLPVQNIAIDLSFEVKAKSQERPASTMSFSIDPMRMNVASAEARSNALANRFPLSLDSIRTLAENGLPGLQLASVVSPISQSKKDKAGYLLEYKLDLGIGIKSYLTIVWWPNGKNSAIHMGLRIPGFDGDFSIVDDLIKIGPKQIQFMADPETGETMLLFRRIGIEMPLGLSLPKDGVIDAALFGDPNNGGSGKVAWYAAWNKPK